MGIAILVGTCNADSALGLILSCAGHALVFGVSDSADGTCQEVRGLLDWRPAQVGLFCAPISDIFGRPWQEQK